MRKTGYTLVLMLLLHCSSAQPVRQQTDILLAGSIHYIPDSLAENWGPYRAYLESYRPDAICIEYRVPTDTVSLKNVYGERIFFLADSLRDAWKINETEIKYKVERIYRELKQSDSWEKRIELYQLLWVSKDFGNADYQAWQVCKLIAALPLEEKNKIRSVNPMCRYIEAVGSQLRHGEFGNVVFPLAASLGIEKLYPVDDWTYNPDYSIAYQNGTEAISGTKFDTSLKSCWNDFSRIEAEELKKGNALMFVNSTDWLQKSDYAQTTQYEATGNGHFLNYVRFWNLRNAKVAHNILNLVGKKQKRVLVVMGYMHIPNIKKHLQPDKSIVVHTIGEG